MGTHLSSWMGALPFDVLRLVSDWVGVGPPMLDTVCVSWRAALRGLQVSVHCRGQIRWQDAAAMLRHVVERTPTARSLAVCTGPLSPDDHDSLDLGLMVLGAVSVAVSEEHLRDLSVRLHHFPIQWNNPYPSVSARTGVAQMARLLGVQRTPHLRSVDLHLHPLDAADWWTVANTLMPRLGVSTKHGPLRRLQLSCMLGMQTDLTHACRILTSALLSETGQLEVDVTWRHVCHWRQTESLHGVARDIICIQRNHPRCSCRALRFDLDRMPHAHGGMLTDLFTACRLLYHLRSLHLVLDRIAMNADWTLWPDRDPGMLPQRHLRVVRLQLVAMGLSSFTFRELCTGVMTTLPALEEFGCDASYNPIDNGGLPRLPSALVNVTHSLHLHWTLQSCRLTRIDADAWIAAVARVRLSAVIVV